MKRRMFVLIAALSLAIMVAPRASAHGTYPHGTYPSGGIYDRGPTQHAGGVVYGNTYTVVQGDTMYSVSKRFGLSVHQLAAANGISNPWWIWPGQRLIIAAGYYPPPPPKPLPQPLPPPQPVPLPQPLPPPQSAPLPEPPPPPPPSPQPPPGGPPYITIVEPVPYSTLPSTFTVHGWGGALSGGAIVVGALDTAGAVIAEQTTTLMGPDVAAGAEGSWSVQLSVLVPADTAGSLTAFSPGTAVEPVVIPVTFTRAGVPPPAPVDYKLFAPGQCQVEGVLAAATYVFPGGPQAGQFAATGPYAVTRATLFNDQYWYEITPDPAQPAVWAPATSLATVGAGCAW